MLLNVIYWINDYRPGGPKFVNPLEKYKGFPYFGFIEDPGTPGAYTLAPICSPPKPVPEHYADHVDQHKTRTRNPAKEAQEAKLKREQAEAEARHAKMVIEAERAERLKKKLQQAKRDKEEDEQEGKNEAELMAAVKKKIKTQK